jgi:hypothetical protein
MDTQTIAQIKKELKEEIKKEIRDERTKCMNNLCEAMRDEIRSYRDDLFEELEGIYDARCEELENRLEPLEYSFESFGDKLELILKKILEKNTEGKEKEIIREKRLMFKKDYLGKNVHITFTDGDDTYQYPHDELLQCLIQYLDIIVDTQSWQERGVYHFPRLSKEIKKIMEQYKI